MTSDLALIFGLLFLLLMFPAAVSDYAADRPPRRAAALFVLGGGLILLAVALSPTGYQVGDIPDVIMRVVAWALGRGIVH